MNDQTRDELQAEKDEHVLTIKQAELSKERMQIEINRLRKQVGAFEAERARASRPEAKGREMYVVNPVPGAVAGTVVFDKAVLTQYARKGEFIVVREVLQLPASEQDYSTPDNAAMSGVLIDDRSQASDEAFEKAAREHFENTCLPHEDESHCAVFVSGANYGRREAAAEIELHKQTVRMANQTIAELEAELAKSRAWHLDSVKCADDLIKQITQIEAELAELKK